MGLQVLHSGYAVSMPTAYYFDLSRFGHATHCSCLWYFPVLSCADVVTVVCGAAPSTVGPDL